MAELQWRETSPGYYERSMDEMEQLFALLASQGAPLNRQHWAVTAAIKIANVQGDLIAVVQEAWKTLRYDSPSLAATIENNKKVYRVAHEEELKRWLKATFIVDDSSSSGRELYHTLRPVKEATLHLLLKSQELVLRTPHDRLDGIGSILLFDNFLSILASPRQVKFGDEAKNLTPPFKLAAQLPDATQAQEAKLNTYWQNYLQSFPSVGLAVPRFDKVPGASQMRSVTLTKEETAKVISKCKNQGFTPTHVVHAAMILAARRHGNHADDTNYVSNGLFNNREKCLPPFNTGKHAPASYSSAWPMVIVPSDFVDTAKQLKKFYAGYRSDPDSLPVLGLQVNKAMAMMESPPPIPPSEPIMSSLGVIDIWLQRTYGAIEVKDFWFGVDMLTPQVMAFLWTLQGEMTIQAYYNEEYHEVESIDHFLQLCKKILYEGLYMRV